jgi:hypothetical protein
MAVLLASIPRVANVNGNRASVFEIIAEAMDHREGGTP